MLFMKKTTSHRILKGCRVGPRPQPNAMAWSEVKGGQQRPRWRPLCIYTIYECTVSLRFRRITCKVLDVYLSKNRGWPLYLRPYLPHLLVRLYQGTPLRLKYRLQCYAFYRYILLIALFSLTFSSLWNGC